MANFVGSQDIAPNPLFYVPEIAHYNKMVVILFHSYFSS